MIDILDLISVEVKLPAPGQFLLGRSQLDGWELLGGTPESDPEWNFGSLATFDDFQDLQDSFPNFGAMEAGPGVFDLDEDVLDSPLVVLADASDTREWTEILSAGTELQMHRGGRRLGVQTLAEVGTLYITLKNAQDPTQGGLIRPGTPIRVSYDGNVFWTGSVSAISVRRDKYEDDSYITITAIDLLSKLTNTTRYGAISGAGSEPWWRRVQRLLLSSPIPYEDVPTPDSYSVDIPYTDWDDYPELWQPNVTQASTYNINKDYGDTSLDGYVLGLTDIDKAWRRIDGLTPGMTYTVTFMLAFAPDLESAYRTHTWGVGDLVTGSYTTAADTVLEDALWSLHSVTFTATETTHWAWIGTYWSPSLSEHVTPYWAGTWLTTDLSQDPYMACDTDRETDLASYLDGACLGGNHRWFINSSGSIEIAEDAEPTIWFSDVYKDGAVLYTDIQAGFDTEKTTNTLKIVAPGVDSQQETYGPFYDLSATIDYGTHDQTIELSITEATATLLAEELLAASSSPTMAPTEVSFVGHDYPEFAAAIEIADCIYVTYMGETYLQRVVNIEHTITPALGEDRGGWFVRVELENV